MEKKYGIIRYQGSVQVALISESVNLNWDYTCSVGDEIPDGRGNGRINISFDQDTIGRIQFKGIIVYDWNCSYAMLKIPKIRR